MKEKMRKFFETQARGFNNRMSVRDIAKYMMMDTVDVIRYCRELKADGLPLMRLDGGIFRVIEEQEDLEAMDEYLFMCKGEHGELTDAAHRNLHIVRNAFQRDRVPEMKKQLKKWRA